MPATSKIEVFSHTQNSSTTVLLPTTVKEGKPLFQISLYLSLALLVDRRIEDVSCSLGLIKNSATVASDTGSWYEVWEATIALWSVCTRQGMEGSIDSMGEFP